MGYGSSDVIARVRRDAHIDSSDVDYPAAVILDIMDSVIQKRIVPSILGLRADYWLTYADIAVTADRQKYPIPDRASLGTIYSVQYLDDNKENKVELEWKWVEDMDPDSSGEPSSHYIQDDTVLVYPIPSSSTGYIRIWYHYMPSNLVEATDCMLITGGVATGVLTGDAPSAWGGSDIPLSYDIVSGKSPFALIHSDLTASAVVSGTSITFSPSDIDTTRLATGTYYVCLAGETCFPMCPKSLHYTAVDLVVAHIRDASGDEGFAQKIQLAAADLQLQISTMFPRKQTKQKPSVNRNSLYKRF
jgi:hypothetical protein